MDWAASEWKEGLSGLARKKVEELEEQLAKHQKMNQQKQLQNEQLEQALNNQKKKTEDEKSSSSQLTRDLQSLCEQNQELQKTNEKLHQDVQFRENQLGCLQGQLTSNKTLQATVHLSSTQIEELQLENRDLKEKCVRLEQGRKLSGSQEYSSVDKIGTPARGRQGLKSEDELQKLHFQNDLLSSQVKDFEQRLKNLSKDRECDRHNQEATRIALEAKHKEKENCYMEEIRNQSQAALQFSKMLEETKIKLQQEMNKSLALEALRVQTERDSANLLSAEKEKREQQQVIQEKDTKLKELENSLAEMKKTLQQYENNQENYRLKADTAEAKVARLEKELKNAESDVCTFKKELDKLGSYEEKNKKLTELLSAMEHNFSEKENAFKALKSETLSLKATVEQHLQLINNLKDENSGFLTQLQSKEKELSEKSSDNETLRKLVSEKQQNITSLEGKIDKSTLACQEKDGEISQLQENLKEKMAQFHILNEQQNTLNGDLTALKLELSQKQSEVKTSEQSLLGIQKTFDLLREDKERIEQQLRESAQMLSKEREMKESAAEWHEKELSTTALLLNEANDKFSVLKSYYQTLEENSKKELSAVKLTLAEKCSESTSLRDQVESQKVLLSERENQLHTKEQALQSSECKVLDLQQSLTELRRRQEASEHEIKRKDKQVLNLEKELLDFNDSDASLKKQISELEMKLQEHSSVVANYYAVMQERDELKSTNLVLEGEAHTLKKTNGEIEESCQRMREELESLEKSKEREKENLINECAAKAQKDLQHFEGELTKMTERCERLEKEKQDMHNGLEENLKKIESETSVKLQNLEGNTVLAIASICERIRTANFSDSLACVLQSVFDKNKNSSIFSSVQELVLALTSVFEKIRGVQNDNERFENIIEEYKARLDNVTSQLDEAKADLSKTSKTLKEIEDSTNQKVNNLETDIIEKVREIFVLNEQLVAFQNTLTVRDQELSQKAKDLHASQQSVAEHTQSLDFAHEEIKKLQKQLEEKEQKMCALGQFENKLSETESLLEQANSNLLAFKASFKVQEEQSSNELSLIGNKLTAKTSEVLLLKEELDMQKEHVHAMQAELSLKEQSLEKSECSAFELQESLAELSQDKEKLENMITERDLQISGAETKLKEAQEIETTFKGQISELEVKLQENVSKMEQYDCLVEEREMLKITNSTLENEICSLKQVNSEITKTKDSLSQCYKSLEVDRLKHLETLRSELTALAEENYQGFASRLADQETKYSNLLEEFNLKLETCELLERDALKMRLGQSNLEEMLKKERLEFSCEKESLLDKERQLLEELSTKIECVLETKQKLDCFDSEQKILKVENENLTSQISLLNSQIEEFEEMKCNFKHSQEELTQKCTVLEMNVEEFKAGDKSHLQQINIFETRLKTLGDELEKVYESNTELLAELENKENAVSVLSCSLEKAEQKLVNNFNLINSIHNSVASIHSILFPDDSFSTGSFDPDFFLMMLEKLKAEIFSRENSAKQIDDKSPIKHSKKVPSSLCLLDSLVGQMEELKAALGEKTSQIQKATEEGTSVDIETNQADRSDVLLTPDADLATRLSECMDFVIESIKRFPTSGSTLLEEMNQVQENLLSLEEDNKVLQLGIENSTSVSNELKFKLKKLSEGMSNILGVRNEENMDHDELFEKLTSKFQTMCTECNKLVATIASLQSTVDEVESYLQNTFDEKIKLEKELENLRQKYSMMSEDAVKTEETVTKLRDEIVKLECFGTEQRREMDALQSEKKELILEFEQRKSELVDKLEEKIKNKNDECERLCSTLLQQDSKIAILKKDVIQEKDKSESVGKQYSITHKKCSEFETQNEFLNKEFMKLSGELHKTLSQLNALETKLQEVETSHENLKAKFDASELKVGELKEQLGLQQKQSEQIIDDLRQDLIRSDLSCTKFEEELRALRSEHQAVQKERDEKAVEAENYTAKLDALHEQLVSIEESNSHKLKHIEAQVKEVNEAKGKLSEIQLKYEQSKKDYESAKSKIFLLNRNARKREELMLKMQADLEKFDTLEKALKEEIETQKSVIKSHQKTVQELEKKSTDLQNKCTEKDEEIAKLWEQQGQLSAKVMDESSKKLLQDQLQESQNKAPEVKRRLKYTTTPEEPSLTSRSAKKQLRTPPSPVLGASNAHRGIITRVDGSARINRMRTRSMESQNLDPKDSKSSGDQCKKARLQDQQKISTTAVDKPTQLPMKMMPTRSALKGHPEPSATSANASKERMDSILKRPLGLSYETNYGSTLDTKNPCSWRPTRSNKEGPSDCAQQ